MRRHLSRRLEKKMRIGNLMVLAGLLATAPLFAQEKSVPEAAGYRVDFNIRDSSAGAKESSRRYVMLIDSTGKGTVRVGAKVPYATGSFSSAQGANSPVVSTQYNYADVGVNIDTRLHPVNGKLELISDLEVSSLLQLEKSTGVTPPNPTISQFRIGINAIVDEGKRTLVASVDDPVTQRKFDVEVTVTKTN
jgi:hypothetical protein